MSAPVDAVVRLPGSKSVTNRALILAALSDEPSRLRRPLHSRDTELMVAALRALGVGVEDYGGDWQVIPAAMTGPARVDVGNAGTVMRFLLPVAALVEGTVDFDGDARARSRPIGALVDALRELGARIDDGSRAALPLTVHGAGTLAGGQVDIDASASSQFVSALLLAGPRFNQGVDVRHVGEQLPSAPHVAMTVDMLRRAGAQVDEEPDRWRVSPGALRGMNLVVEPDLSNAAPFLGAALVTQGRVTVADWPEYTTQPGDALRELFTSMGGTCELTREGLTVTGGETVHGVDVDMHDVGELAPVVAAVASLADTPSRLRGIAHLRGHETDRLAALAKELTGLGGEVRETEDGLRIEPRWLHGGVFATYDDHRLATAAALLGLRVPGVQVENVGTTAKTMPDFVGLWEGMLGRRR